MMCNGTAGCCTTKSTTNRVPFENPDQSYVLVVRIPAFDKASLLHPRMLDSFRPTESEEIFLRLRILDPLGYRSRLKLARVRNIEWKT